MDQITKQAVINKVEKLLDKIKYGEVKIKLGESYSSVDVSAEEVHRIHKFKKETPKKLDIENKFHEG